MEFITRGILIGGACGVFGALFGFVDSIPHAFGVGMLAGALAGYTMYKRQVHKRKRQTKS